MANLREALIVEALGDIAILLERLETIPPALASTTDAVMSAADLLTTRSADAESRLTAFTHHAVTHLAKHLAHRTEELARAAVEVETQALQATGRKIIREELGPPVQRLVHALNDSAHRRLHWPSVGLGAVTAIAASAAAWAGALYLLPR
ncbi:MAG: hypothetical protein EOO80_06705 [Oxalobacteraceae bacterium]|nr:MAG: hypothetical protein EOO80_06705 [Oxalobacteraceae bacterium]